jgi:hypothetical protein
MTNNVLEENGKPDEPKRRLSTAQTCRRLGLSRPGLDYQVEMSRIRRRFDDRGKRYFYAEEVEALRLERRGHGVVKRARTRDGSVAARCFEMLRDGRGYQDIVIELREPLPIVDELVSAYGAAIVSESVLAAIGAELKRHGYKFDVATLPALLGRLLELEAQKLAEQIGAASGAQASAGFRAAH